MLTMSPTTFSPTTSLGCVDPQPDTMTWVLLGVFLTLAFFAGILTRLLFMGISGACKRYNVRSFDQTFRKLFRRPVAVLLCLMFLQLAWNVAPWLCALDFVRRLIAFLILCAALATIWIIISRLFEFAEPFVQVFTTGTEYTVPIKEGLRVLKLVALFILGIVFFSVIVLRLDPNNQFQPSLFFGDVNFISITSMFFFVPLIRDAVGGITYLADKERVFNVNDYLEMSGARGVVERIGLFAVTIRSLDGSATMISNNRLLEETYVVYDSDRKRVVEFRFPLRNEHDLLSPEAQRSIISAVERELHELGLSELFVLYDADSSVGHGLDVRFITSDPTSVETQINLMNDAIFKVMETVRTFRNPGDLREDAVTLG